MWKRWAAALIGMLAIVGCSSPAAEGPAPAAQAGFNGADVQFAQHMIVHHQQAVAMSTMAAERAGDFEVQQLAAWIKKGQQPEIDMLTRWLTAWGRPTAAPGDGAMAGMAGMVSDRDIAALGAAKGTAFDRRFAGLMVDHHLGAIEMARAEQASGVNRDAKALAGQIILTQQSEVEALRAITARLSG